MKRVNLIATGVTIASIKDPKLQGATPTLSATQLIESVTGIESIAEVDTWSYSSVPGHYFSPQELLQLGRKAKESAIGRAMMV